MENNTQKQRYSSAAHKGLLETKLRKNKVAIATEVSPSNEEEKEKIDNLIENLRLSEQSKRKSTKNNSHEYNYNIENANKLSYWTDAVDRKDEVKRENKEINFQEKDDAIVETKFYNQLENLENDELLQKFSSATHKGLLDNDELSNKVLTQQGMLNNKSSNKVLTQKGMLDNELSDKVLTEKDELSNKVWTQKGMLNNESFNKVLTQEGMPNNELSDKVLTEKDELSNKVWTQEGMLDNESSNKVLTQKGMLNNELFNKVLTQERMLNNESFNKELTQEGMLNNEASNKALTQKVLLDNELPTGEATERNFILQSSVVVDEEIIKNRNTFKNKNSPPINAVHLKNDQERFYNKNNMALRDLYYIQFISLECEHRRKLSPAEQQQQLRQRQVHNTDGRMA